MFAQGFNTKASRRFAWLGPAALAVALWGALAAPASAQSSPDCERLRRAIAESGRSGGGQFQAAAERQRSEIERTASYASQLGCDNRKFLFFGSDPPPQCGQIQAQIGRMRANLADLQARAGGGGARADLLARYNDQCGGATLARAPAGGETFPGATEQMIAPEGSDPDAPAENAPSGGGEARAGGKAVCVRTCDGAFFPVSYSASSSRLDSLADMCRALCPNAEVTLYTYPASGDIEQAVSINGAHYMDSPTALRYRKTYDSSCSCKRKGQTWAAALGPAEALLGQGAKTDIVVTPERAAELSRPKNDPPPPPVKGKAGKTPAAVASPVARAGTDVDANGVDTALRAATSAISADTSGIASGSDGRGLDIVGEKQGKSFTERGVDGVQRTVRVVGN